MSVIMARCQICDGRGAVAEPGFDVPITCTNCAGSGKVDVGLKSGQCGLTDDQYRAMLPVAITGLESVIERDKKDGRKASLVDHDFLKILCAYALSEFENREEHERRVEELNKYYRENKVWEKR